MATKTQKLEAQVANQQQTISSLVATNTLLRTAENKAWG